MSITQSADLIERASKQGTAEISISEMDAVTARMSSILVARGLSARVSIAGKCISLGRQTLGDSATAELLFDSHDGFRNLFQRMRLIDFAMAYIEGTMKVVGPIQGAVEVFDAVNIVTDKRQAIRELLGSWFFRFSKAFIPKQIENFDSLDHYAHAAEAYELFLDDHMQYTCGFFQTGDEDLDAAQRAKFHLIERWAGTCLGPLAGKDHLDIGCGWGGMVGYFERRFGTRSLGNTNCVQQMMYAQKRYGCDIAFGDFSRLRACGRRFDLITIVGMMEHLTPHRRSKLLSMCYELLRSGGVIYLQCIAKPRTWIGGDASRLAQMEVFPGHFLELREQTERRLRKTGFEIIESADHALHYALTTARWVDRIQTSRFRLETLLGARQVRVQLGYLAFASRLFGTSRGSLVRYLAKKPG